MGLEMYAYRRFYLPQRDDESEEERYSVQIVRGGIPVAGFQSDRISEVDEEVMFWWKADHIHNWIVKNATTCTRSDDGDYYLHPHALQNLYETCEKVIKASKLVDAPVKSKDFLKGRVRRTAGRVIEDATVAKMLLPRKWLFRKYDEAYLNDVIDTWAWAARMQEDRASGVPFQIYYYSISDRFGWELAKVCVVAILIGTLLAT
jgi:hypothetical protein